MIVADTSALVAIYKREPGFESLQVALSDGPVAMPSTCYLEAVMVLRAWAGSREWLDATLATQGVSLHAIDEDVARLAADAFERYGRNSGHPARLNFGDCMSYATAVALKAKLLFVGTDFSRTDISPVL